MNKKIDEAKLKLNGEEIEYLADEEFTLCIIRGNGMEYLGFTKYNKKDVYNPALGREIAFRRALKKMAGLNHFKASGIIGK